MTKNPLEKVFDDLAKQIGKKAEKTVKTETSFSEPKTITYESTLV